MRYLSEKVSQATYSIYMSDGRGWTSSPHVTIAMSTLRERQGSLSSDAAHHAKVLLDLMEKHRAAGPQLDHVLGDLDANERFDFLHHLWELESTLDSELRDGGL